MTSNGNRGSWVSHAVTSDRQNMDFCFRCFESHTDLEKKSVMSNWLKHCSHFDPEKWKMVTLLKRQYGISHVCAWIPQTTENRCLEILDAAWASSYYASPQGRYWVTGAFLLFIQCFLGYPGFLSTNLPAEASFKTLAELYWAKNKIIEFPHIKLVF